MSLEDFLKKKVWGQVISGCPRTIFQFSKWDEMPVFGHKLPREMQFLPKFKSKMGTKWEICFNFLGQFEFSDSLKLPDPIL
jgi:hypothetical protein